MRISDWSSDVCSSDLAAPLKGRAVVVHHASWVYFLTWLGMEQIGTLEPKPGVPPTSGHLAALIDTTKNGNTLAIISAAYQDPKAAQWLSERTGVPAVVRSEEHTSELQSLMRISYAVFCLKKKTYIT